MMGLLRQFQVCRDFEGSTPNSAVALANENPRVVIMDYVTACTSRVFIVVVVSQVSADSSRQ